MWNRCCLVCVLTLGCLISFGGIWAADQEASPGVVLEETDFWAPNSSTDDAPAGKFSKGESVTVTKEFVENGVVYKFIRLTGKNAAKSGWVKSEAVSILSEEGAHFLPAVPVKVNQMGFRTLRQAAKSNHNSLISPYGIWANLRILQQGAKGRSREEIDALIGAPAEGSAKSFPSKEFRSLDCFVMKTGIELTGPFIAFAKATGINVWRLVRSNWKQSASRGFATGLRSSLPRQNQWLAKRP